MPGDLSTEGTFAQKEIKKIAKADLTQINKAGSLFFNAVNSIKFPTYKVRQEQRINLSPKQQSQAPPNFRSFIPWNPLWAKRNERAKRHKRRQACEYCKKYWHRLKQSDKHSKCSKESIIREWFKQKITSVKIAELVWSNQWPRFWANLLHAQERPK